MALKFRRGTTAQQSGSLAFGEPYVNTTLGTLLIGGTSGDIVLSAGGTGSTGNFGAISGSGLDITGNANIAGNLTLGGAITIGDASADTVNVIASLSSSLIPQTTNAFDLGSATKIWKDLYISTGSIKFVAGTTVVKELNLTTLTALEAATGSANVSVTNLNSFTSSIDTTIKTKMNTDGVVSGSSQITYANISSIPVGIISGSSQLSGTTITDLTVVNLTTVNQTASVLFSSGSNKFGDFGNDTHEFTGSVQISGSITTIGTSTATSFNGVINATNGVISGSSQLTANLPAGTVSGSSQVIGILSSLNTYTGSNDTTNTSQNTSITNLNTTTASLNTSVSNLNTATSSYETKGRSIVSGSSQITFSGISSLPTLVSGSSQITLSATTGGTTASNVQFNSLGIGMAASATTGRIDATNDIVAFSSSDIRFKENIVPIQNALDKIRKISGNTYDWKEENKIEHGYEGNDVGVIAQEIEAVLPQLVQTRENGYKAVKYDKLVALLIEGIKEQQLQIEQLRIDLNNSVNRGL
jgi:hypothetical protein